MKRKDFIQSNYKLKQVARKENIQKDIKTDEQPLSTLFLYPTFSVFGDQQSKNERFRNLGMPFRSRIRQKRGQQLPQKKKAENISQLKVENKIIANRKSLSLESQSTVDNFDSSEKKGIRSYIQKKKFLPKLIGSPGKKMTLNTTNESQNFQTYLYDISPWQ